MKSNIRKGQAALEFLMTYGWAILVVLAAIGALSYFGVLNPGKYLPNKCISSPGIACVEKPQVTTASIAQAITIGTGFTLTNPVQNVIGGTTTLGTLKFCDKSGATIVNTASCAAVTTYNDGSTYVVVFTPATAYANGQSVKQDFQLNYTNPVSGLAENWIISLSGRVSS